MKRFFISCLLILALVFSFIPSVAAEEDANVTSGVLNLNSRDMVVSDVLSFDEVVELIANDNGISVKEATKQLISNYAADNSLMSVEAARNQLERATYRSLSQRFTVTSAYRPSVNFYCETNEGSYYWGIVRILNVGMNREYNGIVKQFGGSVYSHLENAGSIFWIVNGDFYEYGNTTVNGGVNIRAGESATVYFNISHSNNHFAYCYREGRLTI